MTDIDVDKLPEEMRERIKRGEEVIIIDGEKYKFKLALDITVTRMDGTQEHY